MSLHTNRSEPEAGSRTGVWFVGARGSVAATAIGGCAAVAAGLWPPTGRATETPPFAESRLPSLSSFVFGGHDTVDCPLSEKAESLVAEGVLPHGLPPTVCAALAAADAEIRIGGPLPADRRGEEELIAGFAADITGFAGRCGAARTVVVHVAPAGDARLPPSSLYAAAALRAGCPDVDFTPSLGPRHTTLRAAAGDTAVPYAGREGKTGQTLLRAVLAPMFQQHALVVRTWSGTNLLGGGDGAALADPGAAAVKSAGENRTLHDTLGSLPEGKVHIDDGPVLGDWKTAWDHIAFDGFLGARMSLQTIWQGCDSALAAPLVLDLARLLARAHEAGLTGPRPELGFYFKDPDGGSSALADQYTALSGFAERLLEPW
ncbi:inositol-3-phosphate synthase [Streptomyces cinerochromogenes]|uniref:inositol-3-phosphate synthase n=1 Tax=Streptomyces cinerochromogenes TaxID=66422 RepID=UPI0016702878|nr:inositol-3-phosphate synthase [Streptomyces cinerochromogenes]GGS90012.1 hypothetical protein GCM10010206_60950 [Streptomyces cinerochromogenes]